MDFKLRTKGKEEFWWCNCCDARVRKNTTCEKHATTKKHLENKKPRDNAAELVHYFCLIRNKIAEMKIAKKAEEDAENEMPDESYDLDNSDGEDLTDNELYDIAAEKEEEEDEEEEEQEEEEEEYSGNEEVSSGEEDSVREYSDSDSDEE